MIFIFYFSFISYEIEMIVFFIIVLFLRYISKVARENIINFIYIFRDYLYYYIKCFKVRNKFSRFLYIVLF